MEVSELQPAVDAPGHRFSFWELHRMLAECYMADLGTVSVLTASMGVHKIPSFPRKTSPFQNELGLHSAPPSSGSHRRTSRENDTQQMLTGSGRRQSRELDLPPPLTRQRSPSELPVQTVSFQATKLSSGTLVRRGSTQALIPPSPIEAAHAPPPVPKATEATTILNELGKANSRSKNSSLQTLLDMHGLEAKEDAAPNEIALKPHICWRETHMKKAATTMRSRRAASGGYAQNATSQMSGSGLMAESEDSEVSTEPSRRSYLLQPSGGVRSCWNMLVALFVLYDLLVIPLAAFNIPESDVLRALDLTIQGFWNIDFGLTFLTGYYDGGRLVMEFPAVVRHYAKTWMLFDLGLISMDWAFFIVEYIRIDSAAEWSRTLRMLRLMRLVRIARAIKLRRGFAALQELLHSQAASLYLSFFGSLGQLLVLNHWMACAWFGVSWLNADENWVTASGLQHKDVAYQYLSCVLWSFSQLGVGEYELPPTNTVELMLCALIAFRSLITAATLISTMGNLIAGLRKIREDETSEFRLLRRFLKHNEIPHEVAQKVTQFLQHQYTHKQHSRSADVRVPLLDLLSRPLFNELCFERYRASLCKLKVVDDLLEDPDMQTIHALHQLATQSLSQLVAASGDVIFLSGKVANVAYMKVHGSLSYYRDDGVEEPNDSRWISEVCLWTAWVHMGDLEANNVSDMLCLDAGSFCSILNQTYATQRAASIYAKRFLNVLRKQNCLSDLLVDRDHDLDSLVSEDVEPLAELPLVRSAWRRCCPRLKLSSKRRRSSLDVTGSLNQVVPEPDLT